MSTGESGASSAEPTWSPPGIAARGGSTILTALTSLGLFLAAGFLALVVIGGVALALLLLTGHGFDDLQFSNPAYPSTEVLPEGVPTRPRWPTWVAPAVIVPCLVIAMVASVVGVARFGVGTVGDGVTGIEARLRDGSMPSRARVFARVGVPVLVVLVMLARGNGIPGLALAGIILWLPAVAPSRRSVADLVTGIYPLVVVEPMLGRSWDTMRAEHPDDSSGGPR